MTMTRSLLAACLLLAAARGATGAGALEKVSNTTAGKPLDSLVIGSGREASESMAAHRLTVNGKPAKPGTVSLWGKSYAQFYMRTPQPGAYVLSLFLTSGETRRGRLTVRLGSRDFTSAEISAKGTWTPVLYSYSFAVPPGQTATRLTITGNGLYINRAYISRPSEGGGTITRLAPSGYRTVIRSAEGKAKAVVLAPPSGVERAQAAALAKALGVPLKDEPDFRKPLPQYPVKGVDPETNLILLSAGKGGPLVQALRRATLILEDERVPGIGGYAIRTVARPFAKSTANVIVISSSEPASLPKAVRAFRPEREGGETVWDAFLVEQPSEEWKSVRPYYYRVKAGDDYFARERRKLSQPIAGRKGKTAQRSYVRQTSDYGDRYYRTGNDEFARLYRDYALKMEKEEIYGGYDTHMQLYGLMRGWDRVEESPALSPADRLRVTNYLLRCVDGPEGYWRAFGGYGAYSGPVRMRHNHQTILADGLMQAYLYYGRLYDLGGATFWKNWLDDIIADATTWGHAPEDSQNYEPLTFKEHSRLFRYQGLTTRDQPGTEKWLDAARRFIAARDSMAVPAAYGDCWDTAAVTEVEWFRVLVADWEWAPAQWAIDRIAQGYRIANPKHSAASKFFAYQNCSSAAGGPRTVPPPKVKPAELKEMTGLVALPISQGYFDYTRGAVGQEGFWRGKPKPWSPPLSKAFDKIVYRSGWRPGDEYLFVEGIGWADHGHFDLGAIVHYTCGGRIWIVDGGYTNTGHQHHSSIEVSRDGKAAWGYFEGQKGRWGDFRAGPPMAELVRRRPAKAGTAGAFEFEFRVADVAGATWTRAVKGGGGRGLSLTDTLVATVPGEYEIKWRLRLLGDVSGAGAAWRSEQRGASMPVKLALGEGETCAPRKWEPDGHTWNGGAYTWCPFVRAPARPVTLEWVRKVRLRRGGKTRMEATIGPVSVR